MRKVWKKWPLLIVLVFVLIGIMYELGFRINISGSMPIGLYLITGSQDLGNDDLVAVSLPPDLINKGLQRGYIKTKDTMLVKRLIGLPGNEIIYKDHHIEVNKIYNYDCQVSEKDGEGRSMDPVKEGTYILGPDEYWVLGDNNESWDSRYFGPIKRENIYSEVKLILAI